MKYFAGYLIEGEAAEYYQKITFHLSHRFGIKNLSEYVSLHLTLKPPFETEDIVPFEKLLEETAIKEETIPFAIQGFERFGLSSRTIFLDIEKNPSLQEKCEKILHTLADFGDNKRAEPLPLKLHASVARHLTPEESQKVWDYVSSLPAPHFDLQFNNLTLFIFKNNCWEIQKIYHFE